RQIAEALESAHEHGIVHRDLKPANVKVRPDGTVKVLDFGLAKAVQVERAGAVAAPLADSPTFTSPMVTQMGVLLGTAAYMAPEQARGKIVDRRVDIWAFGCVLYEMLCGRAPFKGDNVTDLLSAIVSREPDWTALPAPAPPAVRTLLGRCLEKDPRRRLRDIGEARLILERPQDFVEIAAAQSRRPQPRAWMVPVLAGAVVVLVIATAVLWLRRQTPASHETPRVVTRFDVQSPDNAELTTVFRPVLSLAANGSVLAFTAVSQGVNRIYVRERSEPLARAIPGSEGGSNPSLSPDGKWVVFFADGNLRKAPLAGQATTVAPARDVRGITWLDEGTLVATGDSGAPLTRMTVEGADARTITTLAAGERTHRWPQALPGGKAVLFTVGTLASPDNYDASNIDAVIVATGERRVILKGAAMARYCGDGHLLYSKGPALFAVGFDPDALAVTGTPVQVLPAVRRDPSTGAAHFDCASDHTLAFVPASSGELHHLFWADRQGRLQSAGLASGPYQEARVSPDGTRAVLLNGTSGSGDVWIYEFATKRYNRLTFTGTNVAPMWSADGRAIYYTSFAQSPALRTTIFRKLADGSRDAEAMAVVDGRSYLAWVEPNERMAVLDVVNPTSDRGDIVRVPLRPVGAAERLVGTSFNEFGSAVSPNGQWLAYQSDETGKAEVYVRDLTGSGAHWQVTVSGGEEPHWNRDGRELFYRVANRLMVVAVEKGATFRNGNPQPLFDGAYNTGIESGRSYDVDPTSPRFLLVRPADAAGPSRSVRLVFNWDRDVQR
ncbi:MAG TPA: protein kinase, partial [Vicinamibacterales bacterium]|nr:protein kinase [Vicinamibacterales bacterium]